MATTVISFLVSVPAGTQQTGAQPSLCARGMLSKRPYELACQRQCRQCSQAIMLCHRGVERDCLCHQADFPHSLVTQHYGSPALPPALPVAAKSYGLSTVQVDSCCCLHTHTRTCLVGADHCQRAQGLHARQLAHNSILARHHGAANLRCATATHTHRVSHTE